jgi:hypothetical protein
MPIGIAGLLAGYGDARKEKHDKAHQEDLAQRQMNYQILLRAADNPNITIDEQRHLLNQAGALWDEKGSKGLFGIKALGGKESKKGPMLGDLIFPQGSVDRQIQSGTRSETIVPGESRLSPPPPMPTQEQMDSGPYVNPTEAGYAPAMTREIPAYLRYGDLTPSKIASDQALQQRVAELRASQPFKLEEIQAQYGAQVQAHNKGVDYSNQNTWDIERIIPTKNGGGEIIWRNKAGESRHEPLSGDQYQFFRDPNNPIDQKIMGYASVIKNQNPNLSDEEAVKQANALYMRGVNADIGASEALANQRQIAPPPGEAEAWRSDRDSARSARNEDDKLSLAYRTKNANLIKLKSEEDAIFVSAMPGLIMRLQRAQAEVSRLEGEDDGTKESLQKLDKAKAASTKLENDLASMQERYSRAKAAREGLEGEVQALKEQITTGRERLKQDFPDFLIVPDDLGKPVRTNNKTKPPKGNGGGGSSNRQGNNSNQAGGGFSPSKLDAVRQRLQGNHP